MTNGAESKNQNSHCSIPLRLSLMSRDLLHVCMMDHFLSFLDRNLERRLHDVQMISWISTTGK